MFINLWVRDKASGQVHQVGTDTHDSINFICGEVCYYNLQNGCGTPEEYEWVEAPDGDDYVSVTPEQLRINRELIHKDVLAMLEANNAANSVQGSFHEAVITVSREDFDRINRLLAIEQFEDFTDKELTELGAEKDYEEYLFYVKFGNGSSLTWDLHSGSSNYYDNVVWRSKDESREVVFDCKYKLNDFEFEVENERYIVKVVVE